MMSLNFSKLAVIAVTIGSVIFSAPAVSAKTKAVKSIASIAQEKALPAHAKIYISSKYALELIEVFDDQGALYEKIPLKATTWYALDISKWPLGFYTLKVTNNISSVSKKIMKVR
jgi:hypothetical protein